MTRLLKTVSGPSLGLLLLVAVLPGTGCEGYEPTPFPVGDTAVLYNLADPEYIGQPSGFDFAAPVAVVIEQPKSNYADFDAAFSELDGQWVMLPSGMFQSFDIRPGIAPIEDGTSFEALERAPGDTEAYVTDAAVPLEEGGVYAVRSRQQGACARYAKFEVLVLDPDGILEFRFLRNNLCNDRTLTEPELD